MNQSKVKCIQTWDFTQNSWATYKADKLRMALKDVHINSRRIRCLFNDGHKNLSGGYTEFKLRPDGDIDYWAVCAYCGGYSRKYYMDREMFDRCIDLWSDWLEVK